jgi:Uma2 family endonuclease
MTIAPQTRLASKPKRSIDSDDDDFYPTSDGKPMAETDLHRDLMAYFIEALKFYFADRPDVYVSGNNFVFYFEGDRNARVSPDCYVVFGVPMHPRNSYKVWEEGGRLPAVVFEFTSKKTRKEDVEIKIPLYERALHIPEYFQFDPTGDYLKPRLQGYRLVDGRYQPIVMENNRLYSAQLQLELVMEGDKLRLYDPARQEWLLTPLEQAREAEAQKARAEAAETEVARLRAMLEQAQQSE